MPLSHLLHRFEGIEISTPETIVDRSGWMFAQKCESWKLGDPAEHCTALLVCRSPLVTDLKPMYRPVAELLLNAGRVDMMHRQTFPDSQMMYGRCEVSIYRLAAADYVCTTHTLEDLQAAFNQTFENQGQGDQVIG